MYHNFIVPEICEALWEKCQALAPDLVKDIPVKTKDLRFEKGDKIDPKAESIYLITDGDIYETYDGQLIVVYEKGDLVNPEALSHAKESSYNTDYGVSVDEYDAQVFLDKIAGDKERFKVWNEFLSYLSQSYQILMCYFSRQDTEYLPEFREYKKGETIIQEETEGDEVFTLLRGTAKVISNGEEVGEIHKDEIFGAMAGLTGTKRNATIIATTDCDTLVAESENFRSILSTRPDIVNKLIQDMARTIVSSNERIIELSKEKSQTAGESVES